MNDLADYRAKLSDRMINRIESFSGDDYEEFVGSIAESLSNAIGHHSGVDRYISDARTALAGNDSEKTRISLRCAVNAFRLGSASP